MKLKSIAANQTELSFELYHGKMIILFSYETPVAYVFDRAYAKKTEVGYSTTTTRHINAFLGRYGFDSKQTETIEQEKLNNLIEINSKKTA